MQYVKQALDGFQGLEVQSFDRLSFNDDHLSDEWCEMIFIGNNQDYKVDLERDYIEDDKSNKKELESIYRFRLCSRDELDIGKGKGGWKRQRKEEISGGSLSDFYEEVIGAMEEEFDLKYGK